MQTTIDVNVDYIGDVERGSVTAKRSDDTYVAATWTVADGKGRGFDTLSYTVPDLTDIQAEEVADAACDAYWHGDRTVDWDDLLP